MHIHITLVATGGEAYANWRAVGSLKVRLLTRLYHQQTLQLQSRVLATQALDRVWHSVHMLPGSECTAPPFDETQAQD